MNKQPTITRADATCGAIVSGIRIASLDGENWAVIENAFNEHGVLIFPDQHLSVDEQFGFARRFGEIEYLDEKRERKVTPIGNAAAFGKAHYDEFVDKIQKGNEEWHIDSTYMPLAAKASILSAAIVPSDGGHTEFADMCAAYESLGEAMRERIAGLSAYHSYFHSQALIGHEVEVGSGYGFYAGQKPLRPLVKKHPETGRFALCIGRHAHGIPGLSAAESSELLTELQEFACRPPRVFRHTWKMGDVAVWDNRRLMHRARPCEPNQRRLLYHTRIAGEPETELAGGMTPQ